MVNEKQKTNKKKILDKVLMRRKKWIKQYMRVLKTLSSPTKRAKKTKSLSPKRTKKTIAIPLQRIEEPKIIFPKRAQKSLEGEINKSLKKLLDW